MLFYSYFEIRTTCSHQYHIDIWQSSSQHCWQGCLSSCNVRAHVTSVTWCLSTVTSVTLQKHKKTLDKTSNHCLIQVHCVIFYSRKVTVRYLLLLSSFCHIETMWENHNANCNISANDCMLLSWFFFFYVRNCVFNNCIRNTKTTLISSCRGSEQI